MASAKQSGVNFEKTLDKLGNIVNKMENGDLSLEQSLNLFEEGITLTRDCHTALKNAEQKVQILIEKNASRDLIDYESSDKRDEEAHE
jgi:exodeoxyribonuclease VII small subunit